MPEKKVGIIAFSNDNRAYLLPHLMANYGYNLINKQSADSILNIEKAGLDKSFKREDDIQYPNDSELLIANNDNESIVGTYKSTTNWPTIEIYREDDHYIFNWGVLKGKIFGNDKGGYSSHLGVLSRNFKISNDTLKTGSLVYEKVKS